jgi:iron complex outermembrane receptor protein
VASPSQDFQLRYAYTADRSDDAFSIDIRCVIPTAPIYRVNQTGDHGQRQELEFQHNLQLEGVGRVAWGASWREDAMRSEWVLPGQGTVKRETSRLFGNWEAKPASG